MQTINLTNHFLIAMPTMVSPYFAKTLTYVCEHNEEGALGIVINRPIDLDLKTLFSQIGIETDDSQLEAVSVYYGGPIQMDRGFVLHQPVGNWQSTLAMNGEIGLTTSRDVLQAVADGTGPAQIFVSLGYAGWQAGQLEQEMADNAWLSVEADPNVIFKLLPNERLSAALGQLGINYTSLSEQAGHA